MLRMTGILTVGDNFAVSAQSLNILSR